MSLANDQAGAPAPADQLTPDEQQRVDEGVRSSVARHYYQLGQRTPNHARLFESAEVQAIEDFWRELWTLGEIQKRSGSLCIEITDELGERGEALGTFFMRPFAPRPPDPGAARLPVSQHSRLVPRGGDLTG